MDALMDIASRYHLIVMRCCQAMEPNIEERKWGHSLLGVSVSIRPRSGIGWGMSWRTKKILWVFVFSVLWREKNIALSERNIDWTSSAAILRVKLNIWISGTRRERRESGDLYREVCCLKRSYALLRRKAKSVYHLYVTAPKRNSFKLFNEKGSKPHHYPIPIHSRSLENWDIGGWPPHTERCPGSSVIPFPWIGDEVGRSGPQIKDFYKAGGWMEIDKENIGLQHPMTSVET